MDKKNSINPFRRENGIQQAKSKKELEWGKVKFNPVARAAVPEQATPWAHFKNALINQQQNEAKMNNNAVSQDMLRKREENYRRDLITRKRNEPTRWEDFSDETDQNSSSKTENKKEGLFQQIPSNIKNIDSIKKEDFDSKLLTKNQNNFLKKLITKTTCSQKSSSLKSAMNDMKLKGVKRDIKKKLKKKLKK